VAHTVSAKKRIRQNAARNARNRARKSRIRTEVTKVRQAAESGDAETAQKELRQASKVIDQVAATGTIHKNKAARLRSRLARRVNKARQA
jgi:small subunit ribosomal protein S20